MIDEVKANRLLKQVYKSMAADFLGPFSSISSICEIMEDSVAVPNESMLKHNFRVMKNAS